MSISLSGDSMSGDLAVARARVVRPRRGSVDPGGAAIAAIDRRVLEVLCAHRVVTQDQLARLFPEIPHRTLRYRTRRLHDLGYAGRSRPYRERGSAPNHHWPTRRADALMRGEPIPRGGERKEPNPVFLAHAALLTELYVTLTTQASQGALTLTAFVREGDAREPFKAEGKERALAPDALLGFSYEQGRELRAFVELDLGTMSHARLKAKAELYAAYAREQAWWGRHYYCPPLLFLTTSRPRGIKFLRALRGALQDKNRTQSTQGLTAAAGAFAFQPLGLLREGALDDLAGNENVTLTTILNAARVPYEQARQAQQERGEAEDRERERLREDPAAMREHLNRYAHALAPYLGALEQSGERALRLLLSSTAPPDVDERALLHSIARDLGETLLQPQTGILPSPGGSVTADARLLADAYRNQQRRLIDQLAARYYDGPSLRRARGFLDNGELVERRDLDGLPESAKRDMAGREAQAQRRAIYLEWREQAARTLAKRAGGLGRLTHPPASFYAQLDREHLKVCRHCEEIVYPAAREDRHGYGTERRSPCHYCDRTEHLRDYSDPPIDPDNERHR
jgi:hypothetical protein